MTLHLVPVTAHVAHWLEPALLAVPAVLVVVAIVRSLRDRSNPGARKEPS